MQIVSGEADGQQELMQRYREFTDRLTDFEKLLLMYLVQHQAGIELDRSKSRFLKSFSRKTGETYAFVREAWKDIKEKFDACV